MMKVSAEYAQVLVGEYLDFLELKAAVHDWAPSLYDNHGCMLSPPPIIDEVWHLHVLDTQRYAPDCTKLFGQMIHHDPDGARVDRRNDKIWKRARIERTVAAYKSRFGRSPRLAEVWAFSQGSVWRGEWNAEWQDLERGICHEHVCALAKRSGKGSNLSAFGALSFRSGRFLHDGNRVCESQTPMDLGMESGDAVDFMIENGGC